MLFSPIRLGGVNLANRIVVAPMSQYVGIGGRPAPWHLQHLGGLAIGGAGLLMIESTAVRMDGRLTHGCLCLSDAAQEAALRELVAYLKSLGPAPIGMQLYHAGRRGSILPPWAGGGSLPIEQGGWQTVAPSAVAFDGSHPPPRAMSESEILELVDAFSAAATRAASAGVDVLEIHAVHGSLLHQFLSPLSNHRTDEYGGDLDGRMRVLVKIVQRLVAEWPRERALGVRLAVADGHPAGLQVDEGAEIASRLVGLDVDYVCVSAGGNVPATTTPTDPCYQASLAARVKRRVTAPVRVAGLIVDPFDAEQILQRGDADLVAIGRAFLDDPRWVWRAADQLAVPLPRPPSYSRVSPGSWPGERLKRSGTR